MGRLLIGLGIVVLVGGLSAVQLYAPAPAARMVSIDRIASGFQGTLPLSPDEVNSAMDRADAIAAASNQRGVRSKDAARFCLLLVVLLGGAIAILAGVQRSTGFGKRHEASLTVAIGLFGAASAISTSGAQYLDKLAGERFACVDSIGADAGKTLRSVRQETDGEAARRYLTDLLLRAERCQT